MRHRYAVLALGVIVCMVGRGAASQADPYRLLWFSTPDQQVAAIDQSITLTVEGVAVPESDEAAEALLHAFVRLAFPPEIQRDFSLQRAEEPGARRRAGTRIFELSRQFVLQPKHPGVLTIPPVALLLGGDTLRTRAHTLHVYQPDATLEEARRAVVPLIAETLQGATATRRIGSGFFIAEDALVTAYHVVLDADHVRLQLPDGRRITTNRAWAIDPVRDVAVLYVNPEAVHRAGVTSLTLAEHFDADLQGEDEAVGVAFTAGWPGGVQQPSAGGRYPSLRFGPAEVVRVSSNAVRPGDSGGPLLDTEGRVLGVVSSGRSAQGEPDVLREDVCLATDPRRALAARLAASRPQSLRRMLNDVAEQAPHATVLQEAALLDVQPGTGDVEQRLAAITEAALRAPNDATLQFLAGSVLQAYGEDERAASAYQAALADAADYFPAIYALGHVYYERGDLARARDLFMQTHTFAPYARLGALGLARVYTAQLRYEEAAAALMEVLNSEPNYSPALYLLGYGLLAQGRREEAEALAVRLDRTAPAWADVLRLHIQEELLRPTTLAALPRNRLFAPSP